MARKRIIDDGHGFLRGVRLERDRVTSFDEFPFTLPVIHDLHEINLSRKVTFFVGENGTGKSTLLEAIAQMAGFNPEGGSRNFSFSTHVEESKLAAHMRVIRGARRERTGFFLRAESYFNLATEIEELDKADGGPKIIESYGNRSLHEQSHGESFLALLQHRLSAQGLYLLDEPEAALSPSRQLSTLKHIHDLVENGNSQFVIATHSPILLAYPDALIYQFSSEGITEVAYKDTEHFNVTRDFLASPERFFKHLFKDEP